MKFAASHSPFFQSWRRSLQRLSADGWWTPWNDPNEFPPAIFTKRLPQQGTIYNNNIVSQSCTCQSPKKKQPTRFFASATAPIASQNACTSNNHKSRSKQVFNARILLWAPIITGNNPCWYINARNTWNSQPLTHFCAFHGKNPSKDSLHIGDGRHWIIPTLR